MIIYNQYKYLLDFKLHYSSNKNFQFDKKYKEY